MKVAESIQQFARKRSMSIADTQKLNGIRLAIAKDDELILLLIEDILAGYNCTIAATASNLTEALKMANDTCIDFDAAIFDVNLGVEAIFPVAQILADRGLPFVFATGSFAGDLPSQWQSRPTLEKPFVNEDVGRALLPLIGGEPGAEAAIGCQ